MSSKSLGTLTLDLVARVGGFVQGMDKAERSSAKWRKQVEKDMSAAGKFVGAGIAAGASAFGAMMVAQTKYADEVYKASQATGISTEELSTLAYAADMSGVGFDSLQSSIGKFNKNITAAAEGSKEQVEAFAQLGINVRDSAGNLKSADALMKEVAQTFSEYEDGAAKSALAMKLFGKSGADMIPLLNTGADGIAEMQDRAEKLGLVISTETAQAAEKFNDNVADLGHTFKGVGTTALARLAPAMEVLSGEFLDAVTDTGTLNKVMAVLEGTFKSVVSAGMVVAQVFESVGKGIGGVAAAVVLAAQGNFSAAGEALKTMHEDVVSGTVDTAQAIVKLWSATDTAAMKAEAATEAAAGSAKKKFKVINEESAKAAKNSTDRINEQIEALKLQAVTVALTADEVTLYKLALEGATEAQLNDARAALAAVAAYKDFEEARKKAGERQEENDREVESIADSLRTDEERIRETYEQQRKTILDSTKKTAEEKAEILRRLEEKNRDDLLAVSGDYWDRWLESAETALTSFDELAASVIEDFSGQFGDAFEAMIFDSENLGDAITGMAENMARSVINALGQMIAQWIAYNAVAGLTGGAGGGVAVSGGGIFSALTGMAHDGIDMVPQTGTWLLKKGERVTTAETSAKLDGTLEEIRQGRLRASNDGGGRPVVNQTIQVAGRVDGRTATQIATETARSQRRAQGRLG